MAKYRLAVDLKRTGTTFFEVSANDDETLERVLQDVFHELAERGEVLEGEGIPSPFWNKEELEWTFSLAVQGVKPGDLIYLTFPVNGGRRLRRWLRVFISYCHADEALWRQLDRHLASLKHQHLIDTWCDRQIMPGSKLDDTILQELREADLVLVLVSADSMASWYCYEVEWKMALQRHSNAEAFVVPIILRPVDWLDSPLGELLALPTDGKPVTTWSCRDAAFLDIVKGIRRLLPAIYARLDLRLPKKNQRMS